MERLIYLAILVVDVIVILDILKSNKDNEKKILWIIAVIFLPLLGPILYYFIGMVISRFGSLFIEPTLKKISFLKFADYKSFVSASKKDEKIELFSEVNNTYRTITAMFVFLLLLKFYNHFQIRWDIPKNITALILVVFILVMFLFSYRKQTNYITKRINANKN